MYLSTSTSTEDFPEMYLSTFQVVYKLYLSTDVLKYKVLLPGSVPIQRRHLVQFTDHTRFQKSFKAIYIDKHLRMLSDNSPKATRHYHNTMMSLRDLARNEEFFRNCSY